MDDAAGVTDDVFFSGEHFGGLVHYDTFLGQRQGRGPEPIVARTIVIGLEVEYELALVARGGWVTQSVECVTLGRKQAES